MSSSFLLSRFSPLLLLFIFLLVVPCHAFNPSAEDEDSAVAEMPSTSSLQCETIDGEVKCHKVSSIDLDALLAEEGYAVDSDEPSSTRDAPKKDATPPQTEAEKKKAEENAKEHEKHQNWKEKHVHSSAPKDDVTSDTTPEPATKSEEKREEPKQQKQQQQQHKESKLPPAVKRLKISYYKLLGVEQDATSTQIRKAFNALAILNHPDKCPPPKTQKCINKREQDMLVLNEAKEVLLSAEKRPRYDFLLDFGYKVYDEELYEDIKYAYENDLEYDDGWFTYDPAMDPYESLNLKDFDETFIFYLSVGFTALLIIIPIVKMYEKKLGKHEKKQLFKNAISQSQKKGQEFISALPKKQERYKGDRIKPREDSSSDASSPTNASTSPSPSPSARNTASPRGVASNSTLSIMIFTIVCMLAMASLSSVSAFSKSPFQPEVHQSYYDLLEVDAKVEAGALKKA